jgi:hypothetical protein
MAECTHRSRAREAGYALLTVLIAIAALTPLAAFAVLQARVDALVQQETRRAIEAFRVAESGLEHAVADLAAEPSFDRLGAGPDRRRGTGDDGEYPFARQPPEFFPLPPFRYMVRVVPAGTDRVDLVAWGFGSGTAMHAVGVSVIRDARPYVPAAVSAGAPVVDLQLGLEFRLVGDSAAGMAAIAVGSEDTAADLRARLAPDVAARLIGRGGPPSIAPAKLPELAAFFDAALRRSDARIVAGTLQGDIGHGLFVSAGSLRLADVSGDGIVVVGGSLEIGGTSTFSGVVVALGDVSLDGGGQTTVTGAVLSDRALLLRGSGEFRYDAGIVDRVGTEFSGLLPRGLRIGGWREWPEVAPS